MDTKKSPKYSLPDEIATQLICSYCYEFLSCGPIKMYKGTYACGRCVINKEGEIILPQIFENFLANFTFPCKYYKEGCEKNVQFNGTQKHESKCTYRKISCPKLNCVETILTVNLYNHFQKHHISQIIENSQIRINLNENDIQNLIANESECIVVIKYCYSQATKSLQLSIAPVNEKFQTVDRYKLQICNEHDVDNNISLSQKICHLYNGPYLETGYFDDINLSNYLSILNNPKVVIIKIFLIYSSKTSLTTETLITNNTSEFALLNDVDEENARQILEKCIEDTKSNANSFEYRTRNRIKPLRKTNRNFLSVFEYTDTYEYSDSDSFYLCVDEPKDLVPCQWKGCKHSYKEQEILKHQDECEFKLYICPFLADCQQGLYKLNSSFFNHLETHGQYCPNPNKIEILLYNPNALYRKEKVNNYFTRLNRIVVRITCTIATSGNWRLVCSSSDDIKINVYYSHGHCRLTLKEEEKTNTRHVEYNINRRCLLGCFVEYPRLNAVIKIETCS